MSEPRVIKAPESLRSGVNYSGADIPAFRVIDTDATPSKATAHDAVEAQATTNGKVIGVTTEAFTDDDDVYRTYQVSGRAKIEAEAAIAVGALVMPGTGGKVVTRTGTNTVIGEAKTAAAADTDIIEVELNLPAQGV